MKFEVTAPDGRTLEIEGESLPSESELDEIFATVKPDIDYNKAKVNDIFSVDGLPSDAPSKLQGLGEFFKEGVAKPFAQGYFQQAKGIGGIMNWYADQARLSKESAEVLGISEETRKKLNTFSDILTIAGDSVRFGAEEYLEKDWIKSDSEVFKGEFFENPSWTRASAAVASALPSISSIIAFGKKNFALGYALMAGSENSDIYLEAKEKVGEEKASGLFLAGTAGTAAIDVAMKPVEKIIKPLKGSFLNKMAERAIRGGMEALPEAAQQVLQNAVKKYGYDATQNLWSGVIESAIGGFGAGAIFAGSESLIEQGATDEEIEQLQNVAVESIIANSEELNDIAYQDMKATLNKINEKYANMPETERMRISRELEEGFGKYYEELSKIMPQEQATSNAALIRNQAFFMSDLMGISPKEYFDKYAPKIEKINFDEFNGQKSQFEEVYKRMNEIDARQQQPFPYSQSSIKKMLKDPYKNKDKIIDAYENHFDEVAGSVRSELERAAIAWGARKKEKTEEEKKADFLSERNLQRLKNNPKGASLEIREIVEKYSDEIPAEYKDFFTKVNEENKKKIEIEKKINDLRKQRENLKLPKKITAERFRKWLRENGLGVGEHTADTGSQYFWFSNPNDPEADDVRVSIRDHFKHSAEYAEPDFDLMIDKDNNWQDTLAYMIKKYNLTKGAFAKKVLRYNDLLEEERNFRDAIKTQSKESFVIDEKDLPKRYYQIADENAQLDAENPAYDGETININGVDKTVYNSDGERIAQSEAALRNFYNWFGDSKVVDEQGRPLVVYHGTNAEFDTFDKNKAFDGAFYFSPNKEFAKGYGNIMPTYLSIKNPTTIIPASRIQKEKFSKQGFDGVAYKDTSGLEIFAAFDPNQIKSTSNRGTYSASDNIYYQSAFAGSRVDYDRPSLEAIGSGEGNQAHGWGLYYALSKDVAESYRRAFLGVKYNGVDWKDTVIAKYDQFIQDALLSGDKTKQEKITAYFENSLIKEQTRLNAYLSESTKNMSNSEKKERKLHIEAAQEQIKKLTPVVDFVKSFDISKLKTEGGQVHEVDIPENPYLLDEQKSYREQSDFVRQAIQEIDQELQYPERKEKIFDNRDDAIDFYDNKIDEFEEKANGYQRFFPESFVTDDGKYGVRYVDDYTINEPLIGDFSEITGEGIYSRIARQLGSQKAASQMLEKHGVKGITYFGRTDGRCFVIFNPDDVKVIQKFYQGEQNPQGAYANDTIYLFENANESTLPHELSHRWDRELRSIAEETGNERVKAMLEQVDTWEESEFKRKFNVVKRDNGYAVVNKKGDVVYDDRGRGFLTEQDAKDYGKKELFARGFEQYLREGKAPNNSLKQAFRNFFMWLKKIYRDAMDLNIQLSPDIKNVYADILGGTDIDFFLESTPESFIQQRIKLGQDKETAIDRIIQDAIANKKQIVKNKGGKGFSEVWAKAMIPLSTRAKRISPKLRNVLRKYEFTLSNELNKKYAKVTPFMNIWKGMSEDDAIAFDFALKNDYVKKQLEIVDKYNARKEWEAVRETLEQIYDEAINAGLDINWRPDYFPRKVKDVDGFLAYIHNMPEWTRFQQAIDEAGLSGATAEEQAEFLNKYLRGFTKVDLMPNKYGSEKQRKIEIVDNEMNQFYAPSLESLVSYIEGLNSRVVSANFLGKGANIDESIGGYLTYLLNNNIIAPNQIDEVRTILRARFDARGVSNRWLANARNYSYMYTMGGLNSAITQIEDLSVAMYKAGVWNTLTTAMGAKRITKKDLGLTSISAEFVEQSKSGELLNKLFKLTGLDAIDSLGKETLVNAELKKFQKMSDETLREYLEPIMENETEATIKDIKNDVISDNVLYLMFSELSDVQPVSLSELPEFYNRGGNLRVLYMLKSFAVKRIDTFRNECIDKIKSKDLNVRKEGLQNMFKLVSLMILCGATKDWLIDLLYGRDTDISERLLNNILGLVGISKFQIYQAKEKGFTGTVKDIVVPPLFAFFDDLFTDTVKVANGKREIKDMEVLKGIPLVGRFYYWWFGRGAEKSRGKKKKY